MTCGECGRYTQNMRGENVANMCDADMMDEECQFWFRRVGPLDECHRPSDFVPCGDADD